MTKREMIMAFESWVNHRAERIGTHRNQTLLGPDGACAACAMRQLQKRGFMSAENMAIFRPMEQIGPCDNPTTAGEHLWRCIVHGWKCKACGVEVADGTRDGTGRDADGTIGT